MVKTARGYAKGGNSATALKPNCPNCIGFAGDARARATTFKMPDGLVHAAPDMWLAGRSRRFERTDGDGIDAFMEACGDFAFGCELARIAELQLPAQPAIDAWTARNTRA